MTPRKLFLVAALALSFTACKKGDTGPAGTSGKDGNANVTVYNFGSQAASGGSLNYTLTVTQGKIDSSLILVYSNPSTEAATAWYPVPGLGSGGSYEARFFIYQTATTPSSVYTLAVRLLSPGGTAVYSSAVTFTKLKVVLAPASTLINGRMAAPVDYSDYYAVKAYYHLPD
jgi:hypothetical protein